MERRFESNEVTDLRIELAEMKATLAANTQMMLWRLDEMEQRHRRRFLSQEGQIAVIKWGPLAAGIVLPLLIWLFTGNQEKAMQAKALFGQQ